MDLKVRENQARRKRFLLSRYSGSTKTWRFVSLLNAQRLAAELLHAGNQWTDSALAWLEAGVHIKAVTDLLGHSSIAITGDVYGHTSDDTARSAVDGLAGG